MLDILRLCRINEVPTLLLLCLLGLRGIKPYGGKERPNWEVWTMLDDMDVGSSNTARTIGQSQYTVGPRNNGGQSFRFVHVGLNDLGTVSCECYRYKSVNISASCGKPSGYLEPYRY